MLMRRSLFMLRGCSSVRWRSAHAHSMQPSSSTGESTIDPEWATAKPYKCIPGPSVWQLFTGFSKGGRYAGLDLIELHYRLREEFGDLYRVPGVMGRPDVVMSFSPEDFEKIFRTEGQWPIRRSFDTMTYYRLKIRPEIFGEMGGLVTSQGELWQKMRSISNPVLMHPKTVKVYLEQVDEVCREFMTIMANLRDDKQELPVDFNEWISRWALETTGVLALDSRLGVMHSKDSVGGQRLVDVVDEIFQLTYQLDVLPSVWRYYKTPSFKRLMVLFDELTNIIMDKIDQAMERFEKNPTSENNQSVLKKLLKINKHIAVIMALDMIFAGIDTTSSGSVGILYCLAKHPDKQSKLREELRTIMPSKDTPLTASIMSNLPYLRACIKEGIRLFPPTAGNFRATGRDMVLQGYRIPKDTDIAMGSLVLMRDENYFVRSKEFLPERWLNDRDGGIPSAKEVNPFIFLPFGFGSRSCIGKRLAMMEMEVLLARLIRRFDFRWNYEDYKVRTTVINLPGSPLRFQVRDVDP
uniref:Cytochrome P450 n=1 Tax=Anopheles funestus TaxID=62324 RepID=A0A182S4Q2_ANOFN